MGEYTKDVEKQQMRDEMAMRVMAAWCAPATAGALGALVNPDLGSLGDMRERAKQYALSAFAIADGFMAARADRVKTGV